MQSRIQYILFRFLDLTRYYAQFIFLLGESYVINRLKYLPLFSLHSHQNQFIDQDNGSNTGVLHCAIQDFSIWQILFRIFFN